MSFPKGLFARDDQLSRRARPRSWDSPRGRAGDVAGVELVGRSVTVACGPERGGSMVALVRAQRVAAPLAQGTYMPLTCFRLSAADYDPRSGDGTAQRTVTARVLRSSR